MIATWFLNSKGLYIFLYAKHFDIGQNNIKEMSKIEGGYKMKKMLITIFALLLLSFSFGNATAEPLPLPTVVNGHVYAADGSTPVSGTEVSVTCDGLGPLVDTTDSEGYYVVEFLEGCDIGDTVEVSSGGVSDTDTVANAVIWKNLVYVNLTVPEFGVITALAALAGSVLVFTVIRKRGNKAEGGK